MFAITRDPLAPAPLVEAVRRDEAGAVALFYGVVRNENLGRRVQPLLDEPVQQTGIGDPASTFLHLEQVAVHGAAWSSVTAKATTASSVSAPAR